ncbi:phospholipase A2-like protein [Curtobacterium sp. PhB42]|uniref:phospholipase A2 n=1 Tax=unclassified Curtobacterium TaxID=257496 RepID=UPI0010D5AC73|nr:MULTISPECIES: phospholipase A2 [unclassified Curtobacterium]TDW43153.1 phospholipase A2-like protein [Curtobacterium sp. PhB42]TDW53549.1 phospholipase A2-like protein [Curtobacterium sp. PhB190]
MRTLLHAPRTRKRSIAVVILSAIALVGSLLVATPAQAINDTGTGGVFVPATGRVLDTKNGVGGYSTPMEAGKYRTIKIAGLAGIPDDGSVGAVSLNATVGGSTDNGTLFGRPNADTSRTMMLIYNDNTGEYVSNSAIVAVNSDGTIQVATETASRLILDVQGYYTSGEDGTAAGGFVPVAGKRIVDTRSGLGAPKAILTPGSSIDVQVAGANGVPANASAAVVNLVPQSTSTSDGYLTPYPTGTTAPKNALHYAPSTNTSIQAQVQLSSSGKMTIANPSGTANLAVDLQGYFTAAGTAGATFTPGIGRVYNSTASGETVLAANETRSIQVTGKAGVPVMGSGINAVVLTLTAYHGGSEGRATVWADGTAKPDTTSINFRADEIRTNTITVPVGANGKISLNNIASPTNYLIDVQGWYANAQLPRIACDAPFAAGAWAEAPTTGAGAINCTFSAPSAFRTGQELQVNVNGLPEAAFALSEGQSSSFAYQLQNLTGSVKVEAFVTDGVSDGPVSSYQFGVGDWSTAALIPSIADNSVISGEQAVLAAMSSLTGSLPADASVAYTVVDQTDGTVFSTNSNEGLPTALTGLPAGHSFEWSAKVRALSDWTRTTEVSTPTWRFRVANDGEPVTSTEPEEDQTANSGAMSSMASKSTVNGCTGVPQSWGKAYFKPVCNNHDRCYAKESRTSRLSCDNAFLAGLQKVCRNAYSAGRNRNLCYGIAAEYYFGVRNLGLLFYKGKGSKV